jgi:hypothetical protein
MKKNVACFTVTVLKYLVRSSSSSSSALQPWVGLGLLLRFCNNIFLHGGVVSLTPNPQPGGPSCEIKGVIFRAQEMVCWEVYNVVESKEN